MTASGLLGSSFTIRLASAASPSTTKPPTTKPPAATTTTTSPGGSVLHLSGGSEIAFILVVVGVFAAIWFGITLYDRWTTNEWRTTTFAGLAQQIVRSATPRPADPPLTVEEAKELAAAVNSAPRGTPGLTRTLLALGLLALVGVALVTLVVGNGSNASDLLKTVVTALTGALTTILGFYFGAKTTTDATTASPAGPATKGASTATGSPTVPGAPSIGTPAPTPNQAGAVTVPFDAPSSDGGAPITSYTVTAYQGGNSVLSLTTPQTTADPVTIYGLTTGQAYTFSVHASNRIGDGKESATSDPANPT